MNDSPVHSQPPWHIFYRTIGRIDDKSTDKRWGERILIFFNCHRDKSFEKWSQITLISHVIFHFDQWSLRFSAIRFSKRTQVSSQLSLVARPADWLTSLWTCCNWMTGIPLLWGDVFLKIVWFQLHIDFLWMWLTHWLELCYPFLPHCSTSCCSGTGNI